MVKFTVSRNGATRRIDMAREFIRQSESFCTYRVYEMVETIRSYEAAGQFIVTTDTLTIIHYC